MAARREARSKWERRYRDHPAGAFAWHLGDPPDRLVDLVERRLSDRAAALDLGCGSGVVSGYLARFFGHVVGVDIAPSAVAQARDRARADGVSPAFVVAQAPFLPFRAESFSLVFDRGCLQSIPRRDWQPYFREVTRLLSPGGLLQVFASKPTARFPPLLSMRGIRSRLRWFLRRRGPQFLTHDLLLELAAPGLQPLVMEDSPLRLPTGSHRVMTHAVFRKTQVAQAGDGSAQFESADG